jgi:hypothetical protein
LLPVGLESLKVELWDGLVGAADLVFEQEVDMAAFHGEADYSFYLNSDVASDHLRLVVRRWEASSSMWLPLYLSSGRFDVRELDYYREYQWDYHNRLTKALVYTESPPGSAADFRLHSAVQFEYDVLGNRVGKFVEQADSGGNLQPYHDEHYVNAGGQFVLQYEYDYDQAGPYLSREAHHLWARAVDQLLATEESRYEPDGDLIAGSDRVVWSLTDHQGTVRNVVDSSGAREHITYDAFGTPGDLGNYDSYGRPIDAQDGVNKLWQYQYDAF